MKLPKRRGRVRNENERRRKLEKLGRKVLDRLALLPGGIAMMGEGVSGEGVLRRSRKTGKAERGLVRDLEIWTMLAAGPVLAPLYHEQIRKETDGITDSNCMV